MKFQFTLIEAAVATGCAGMLAAITAGAAAGMNARAMRDTCRDTLKKFGEATAMYSSESDGFLPYPGLDWYEKRQLGNKLDAWLTGSEPSKNLSMFVCPADGGTDADHQKLWRTLPDRKGGMVILSYGINLVATGIPNNPYFTPHRTATMDRPAECLLFADASARDIPGDPKRILNRHEGEANLVYADGHTAGLPQSKAPVFRSHLRQGFWVGGQDE